MKGIEHMNTLLTLIIQYVILLSIPLLCALVVWLCQQLVRSLPTQQRDALEQFARIAVQQVEQQNASLDGTAKKQLAISLVIKLFSTFKISQPPEDIIDAAIEAAVFFINQLPADVRVEKQGEQTVGEA
jgi:LL-H family phage holin